MKDGDSDTRMVLASIMECGDVLKVLSSILGPWAMTLMQVGKN